MKAEAKRKEWKEQHDEMMRKWREDIIQTSKGEIGPFVEAMAMDIVREYDRLLMESEGSTASEGSWSNPAFDALNKTAKEIKLQCEKDHGPRSAQFQTADTLPNLVTMAFDADPCLQEATKMLGEQLGCSVSHVVQCATLKRVATIIEKCVTKYAGKGDVIDVNRIKDAIKRGEYPIDFDRISDALLEAYKEMKSS